MDLVSGRYTIHDLATLAPVGSPAGNTIFGKPLHSSDNTSVPIIAIAIIGILTTAFLLVSYYIFVIKCCLNWHRIDFIRRFSFSRSRRHEDPFMGYAPAVEHRGLDESVIRSIPIFQYKKGGNGNGNGKDLGERSFCECAVCLNEFLEEEKLRMIPNCCHVFHIDCIDVWLQNNANCPLCRTSISSHTRFPLDQYIGPSTTPLDPNPMYSGNLVTGDEDYVVVELGNIPNSTDQTLLGAQERLNSGELPVRRTISPLSRKLEQRMMQKKAGKFQKGTSMGDECIDIRENDDQFAVEPIRRSFSMDSSADRQLFLAVRDAVQHGRNISEVSPIEGSSNRVRRSFFSFGHGRGSRNAVSTLHLDP